MPEINKITKHITADTPSKRNNQFILIFPNSNHVPQFHTISCFATSFGIHKHNKSNPSVVAPPTPPTHKISGLSLNKYTINIPIKKKFIIYGNFVTIIIKDNMFIIQYKSKKYFIIINKIYLIVLILFKKHKIIYDKKALFK